MESKIIKAYGAEAAEAPLKQLNIQRRYVTPQDVEIEILFCGRLATQSNAAGERLCRRSRRETREGGIELEIVAGDLLAHGDVDNGEAGIEHVEIGVRLQAVVHELAVVAVDDAYARKLQMRIAIAVDEILHMRRERLVFMRVNEQIEFRIEPPKPGALGNELASKNPQTFDQALGGVGSNQHHVSGSPSRLEASRRRHSPERACVAAWRV